MKTLFVTGTDTGVGKTWVSCCLTRELRDAGRRTGVYKPVCSGSETLADGSRQWPDVQQLCGAAGLSPDDDRVCPQRFTAAVAPNVAARLEGCTVDNHLLHSGLSAWNGVSDYVVIEGAGGLLSPLSDQSTVADLAMQIGAPLLIVAANRLGVINHTLMTVEIAAARGLQISGVVLNTCMPGNETSDDQSRTSNSKELVRLLNQIPLFISGFQSNGLSTPDSGRVSAASLFT